MKPEQLYQELKELAEKLEIQVVEQNLRETPGIKVRSGLCRVKDKQKFIMDKHKHIRDKAAILAACLGQMPLDHIFIVPAVREAIDRYASQSQADDDDHE